MKKLCVVWFSHHLGYRNWLWSSRSAWPTLKPICAALLLCVATAIASPAQTFELLRNFNGFNGGLPAYPLVQGLDGNFYGTAPFGGYGVGVVFKVTPKGTLTVLHTFAGQEGAFPASGLLQTKGGIFYGTTMGGGTSGAQNNCDPRDGCGTIFEITPQGNLTTLYSFCEQAGCPDGAYPEGTLLQGVDGHFYGTTAKFTTYDNGTVFKFNSEAEKLKTLYNFCPQFSCPEGANPEYGVIQAADGTLYGTTQNGGANGLGEVFRISRDGKLSVLHSFAGAPFDGADVLSGLVLGSDGNLYGTTVFGGSGNQQQCQYGCGTIFKVSRQGELTILHNFCRETTTCADGNEPWGGLVEATDGNLYGVTALGGAYNQGTIFRITPRGELTTLHNFCEDQTPYCYYGAEPNAALMQGTDGKLYGTTSIGGDPYCAEGGCGTIFSLSLGLRRFVKALPAFGKAGMEVEILGNNLVGTTGVKFHGIEARFEVVSNSQLKTWVPADATTGRVEVKTSSGLLKSDTEFRVTAHDSD